MNPHSLMNRASDVGLQAKAAESAERGNANGIGKCRRCGRHPVATRLPCRNRFWHKAGVRVPRGRGAGAPIVHASAPREDTYLQGRQGRARRYIYHRVTGGIICVTALRATWQVQLHAGGRCSCNRESGDVVAYSSFANVLFWTNWAKRVRSWR